MGVTNSGSVIMTGVAFTNWDGGIFIEQMRRAFVEKYDFVLVDSRTGITDISGICSVHLPDILVAVFTPGPQSQKGLVDALKCVEANRRELRPKEPLRVVPLPCRVDRDVAREAFDSWFERLLDSYFAEKVSALGGTWRADEYFRRVAIEHFSRFVCEDTIESLVHHVDDEAGNAWKYKNLIKVIDSMRPIDVSSTTLGLQERLHERVIMAFQPTALRREVGADYSR
jgi:MinD-like ATPase involved in chromosome partitioning or flagellar assembly